MNAFSKLRDLSIDPSGERSLPRLRENTRGFAGSARKGVCVRALRRSFLLCSVGLFALVAEKTPSARADVPATRLTRAAELPEIRAQKHIETARQLISNAIPEERPRAEQELVNATRLCRNCFEAYAELGRLWLTDYTLGRAGVSSLQKAAGMAEISKELSPNSPLGDYLGVEILLTIGRQAEAFKLYSRARQAFPDHVETLAFDARLWAEVEPLRSLNAAQQAISQGYPIQQLSAWIGNAIIKSTGEEKSGEALQKFAEVYPDRWLWHRAAMAHAAQKNWVAAIVSFRKAIELGNNLESPLQLAILEYKEMNLPKEGAQRLIELLKVVETHSSLSADSRALVESHAAYALLASNQFDSARRHAEKALDLSVNNQARVLQIVETFRNGNQLTLLADALHRITLSNPLLEEVHLALAMISSQRKDYPSTLDHLSSAIALAPNRDDLYSARGYAAYLATKYEIALQDFETAIKQKPEHATYHYNRACLLSLLGRNSEAFESLKTAVLFNEALRQQAGTDTDLENLRQDKEFEVQLTELGIPVQIISANKNSQPAANAPSSSSASPLQRVRPDQLD